MISIHSACRGAALRAGPRTRERQLALAQALAHVGSWEHELLVSRLSFSDELCRIIGQPIGFAPTWYQMEALVHAEDRERFAGGIAAARLGQHSDITYRVTRPDGETRFVRGLAYGRVDGGGRVSHLFGTVQDVTDEQEARLARADADELLQTAFAHAPTAIAVVDLDGRWLRANPAACRILGWSEDELSQRTALAITHPDDRPAHQAQADLLLTGQIPDYQAEKRYVGRSGAEVRARVSVTLVRDGSGRPRHYVCHLEDLSRSGERLAPGATDASTAPDYAGAIIRAMHEGYALIIDGEIRAVNEALCTLTGFSAAELIGARAPYPFWPPELHRETTDLASRILADEGGSVEMTLMRADGARFEAEVTAAAALDADGEVIGLVNTMRDVSVQRRRQRDLAQLARTDSLTGLASRDALEESLGRELEHASGDARQTALVLLDVDRLTRVNDAFGHPTGDAVLVEVARRLARTVRAGEVLARVGGEEFGWLLPACTRSEAIAAADRARAVIASRPFPGAGTLTLSAGVGVTGSPADRDALYRLADRALQEAKQQGRDCTCCEVATPARPGPAPVGV